MRAFYLFVCFAVGVSFSCKQTSAYFAYEGAEGFGQVQPEFPWVYSPEYLFDGRGHTGICFLRKNPRLGFSLDLKEIASFDSVQIWNGNQKSAKDFQNTDSVASIQIYSFIVERLTDGRVQKKAEDQVRIALPKGKYGKTSWFTIPLPQKIRGNRFEMEILESHGDSSTTCLSEWKFGHSRKGSFEEIPWQTEEPIKKRRAGFLLALSHWKTWIRYLEENQKSPIDFYHSGEKVTAYFKKDQTFSLLFPSEEWNEAINGSYSIILCSEEGIFFNLQYYDKNGLEQNETWVFRDSKESDDDFLDFKARLGTSYSELFSPKKQHLLVFKAKERGKSFYYYELLRLP